MGDRPVLLLDVDGTLIEDRAYRQALVLSAQTICERRGLSVFAPTDHEINILHSCGFSNEWDSLPFAVGINLLHSHLSQNGHAGHGTGTGPDFGAWARRTQAFDGLPNERARDALLAASPPALHPDIHALLDDVRDPRTSLTTRLLYNFVLGARRFEAHYGLAPEVETLSLLEMLDAPLLTTAGRACVLDHPSAIYTARPSLPPAGPPGLYQTPEAEIALGQLELEHVPCMGLGPMQWLVDQFGGKLWDYAKPGPVQAIAAMLSALGMPAQDAALGAYQVTQVAQDKAPIEGLSHLHGRHVYVFEDNAGGVRAAQQAGARLAQAGVMVTITGYGIAKDDAKRSALAQVCERIFGDVNEALAALTPLPM